MARLAIGEGALKEVVLFNVVAIMTDVSPMNIVRPWLGICRVSRLLVVVVERERERRRERGTRRSSLTAVDAPLPI